MDRIAFIDIDGILNHQEFYDHYDFSWRNKSRDKYNDEWGEGFCPETVKLMNELIRSTKAKVVISSSKRFVENGIVDLKKFWKARGLKGQVIGFTPFLVFKRTSESVPRGCEIEEWLRRRGYRTISWSKEDQLRYMKASKIANYIIIDDDSDMLYNQRNHFIHCPPPPRNFSGFNEKHLEEAISKLSKTVIELNYQ